MVTTDQYKQAERAFLAEESRRGWTIHAAVYGVVITGLAVLNVLLVVFTDASFFWFPFPLVGWGIGLAMHYRYGVRLVDREIERRQAQIERLAERLRPAA